VQGRDAEALDGVAMLRGRVADVLGELPAGMVGVSWLDRRNDPADVNFQAFAGISSDGGLSFQPNVQLTSEFSNPNQGIGPFSDFDGCTWNGPNYFLAAWMQLNTGRDTQINVGGIRLK